MTSPRPPAFSRLCAAFVAAALALQPMTMYAVPITTSPLSETPLQGSNPPKPNIMFTLDDSDSMRSQMLPDYVGQEELTYGLSDAFNPGAFTWCLGTTGRSVFCSLTSPPLASKSLNHIYYDPAITYAVGKRPDGTNLPCEATDTPGHECEGPLTAVYTDGFAGYPGANTGPTTNLLTGYPDEVFCSTTTPSAADLATGVTDGSACRYNGVTYGGGGGYRYPNASYPYRYPPSAAWCTTITPTAAQKATAGSDGSVCRYDGFTYGGVPFVAPSGAYTRRVLPSQPLTGNPYYYTIASVQFCATRDASGWGTGTCGPRWSTTNRYVSYGAGGFDPAAFARVDISPSDTAQMRNFARWYVFSRSRILAMKTAAGIAFSALDQNSRVGFNTLNTFSTKFLNVRDFDATNKPTWFTNFYSIVPTGTTPSIDAMWRVGEYFSNNGTGAGLPGAIDPLDPATGKCQSNFHLLATDGYANQPSNSYTGSAAGAIGNQDRTVPSLPNLPGATGFTPGQPFPLPYREGSTATANTMADIGMYYWINDLRSSLDDVVGDTRAPWQHVNFYGLALGAEGTLAYPSGVDAILAGTATWPTPLNNTASAIDDLWHAAINGGGKYFNAQNAKQLAEDIVGALSDFTSQFGTGTAVGLAGAQVTATRNFAYRTSYELGWWGDVKKYALSTTTGALPVDANGNPANPPVWAAAAALDTMAAGAGWDSNRRIVTINDSSGAAVPFRFANLSNTQQTSLNAGYTVAPVPAAAAVLDFLRGDRSNEGTTFRVRKHILGDIVSSAAVPVGAPGLPYDDAGNPGYTAFKTAKSTRTPAVYVGANDGMVHAFDDSATASAGKETWAYIPKALFTSGDPNETAHTPDPNFQIGALSYKLIPIFQHRFYVNATPRIWDIDFANTNTGTPPTSGNDWRTLLVGGLGAGGRAVYALDVTTPVAVSDTEAAVAASGRVLWEFTDADLGYVYDAPTLVKTRRYGWVALVASGYNNTGGPGHGRGFLYVLNPTNGAILQKLSTGVGSDTDPSGLSTIRAFTSSRKDPYVLQAYGGDLKGNVWRFDLSDPDETKWKVELIAALTDKSGHAQPITTGIRIEIDQNNNVDRYLFVGTGKLLSEADLADTSVTNALYVIRDGTRTAAELAPATPYSYSNLTEVDRTQTVVSTPPNSRGWVQFAPSDGSRIITDLVADVQTVVWATSKQSSDPCDVTLTSTLYARDFITGNSVLQSAGGAIVPSIDDIGSIAGSTLIQTVSGAGGSSGGDVRIQVTTTKGQVLSFGVKLAGAPANKHRVSWRLLNRD